MQKLFGDKGGMLAYHRAFVSPRGMRGILTECKGSTSADAIVNLDIDDLIAALDEAEKQR